MTNNYPGLLRFTRNDGGLNCHHQSIIKNPTPMRTRDARPYHEVTRMYGFKNVGSPVMTIRFNKDS